MSFSITDCNLKYIFPFHIWRQENIKNKKFILAFISFLST